MKFSYLYFEMYIQFSKMLFAPLAKKANGKQEILYSKSRISNTHEED